jgi:predicted MPP superfamily phosphohydrolase
MSAIAAVRHFFDSRTPWAGDALELGLRRALHIREERLSAVRDACRLLYVSDIHLRSGRSDRLCAQVVTAVAGCKPDVVLLGGDLVDRASELGRLTGLVGQVHDIAPVLAVGGNHDQRVGMDRVRAAVERGSGRWIHDGSARLTHGDRVIAVSGPGATRPDAGDVRVLCAHHPRIWRTARHGGYDLVLAGHLHGCQVVAWEYRDHLLPGAMLYPNCVLRARGEAARLVVSRGVSDLVPIRWRCPREVVLCFV